MKRLWLRLSFLSILAVSLISLSCDLATSPRLGLNIVASVSQQTAENITFRIGVENTGRRTKTLNFFSSQFFDIEVKDRGGHLLWQFSYHVYFLDVGWDLELAPGESSQVREYVWDLTRNDQEPLNPGSYKARIYITNSPRDEGLSTVLNLTI